MRFQGVPESISRRYRGGMCDALALAIHQETGWDLIAIEGWPAAFDIAEEGDDLSLWLPAHLCVRTPDLMLLDIAGLREEQEVIDTCEFFEPVSHRRARMTDAEEARYTFTGEGVSDSEIAEALDVFNRYIRPQLKLQAIRALDDKLSTPAARQLDHNY